MFTLFQLEAEFPRKQTQHNKSSLITIWLEGREKCSIAYGCLNRKQMHFFGAEFGCVVLGRPLAGTRRRGRDPSGRPSPGAGAAGR